MYKCCCISLLVSIPHLRRVEVGLFAMYLQVVVLAILSYYAYKWLIYRLKYDMHKVPSPPKLPILGHLHHLLRMEQLNQNKFILEWYKKLNRPKVMLKTVPGDTALIVFDPDFVKNKVLGKNGMPRDKVYNNLRSVLVGDNHPWTPSHMTPEITPFTQAIRKTVSQSFSASHIRHAFKDLKNVVERAIKVVEKKAETGPVDLHPIFGHMTTDVVGDVGFHLDLGGLDRTGKIYDCFIDSFECFTEKMMKPHYRLMAYLFPNSEVGKRWRTRQQAIFREHEKIVEEIWKRPYPDEDNNTLWANLRRLIDPETGKEIESKKLAGELISIVGAAMDTTGHQLGWIFAILSDHDEVVERILDDMKDQGLYGPNARDIEFSDLASMPYLTAVLKECMRMCASISLVSHRCTKEDMTIFGYRIPKETQIFVPANVYCKLEEYCEEPNVFKPDRWLDGNKSAEKFFLAFSYGPRDCAGQRLAMMELQITLLLFIAKFKIKLSGGKTYKYVDENQMYESIMLEAKGGLEFDIELRK